MLDQQTSAPLTTRATQSRIPLLGWLRAMLASHSDNMMHWVSYVMIGGAMALFVIWQDVSTWRFYSTLGVLSLLLVLNTPAWAKTTGVCDNARSPRLTWLFFALSTILVLAALALSGGGDFSFIPYLLFMLAGQATATFTLRGALAYNATLVASFAAILWLVDGSFALVLGNIMTVSMGMVFVMMFTLIAVRYGEQTARAEALLIDLRAANTELAAARERDRDLAVAQERLRLARDIHDGLGHHLTVLNIQLEAAAKLINTDPQQAAASITTCREVAQAALQEVRHSVAAMRHTPLEGRTLDAALRSLVEQFDAHSPVTTRFELHGTPQPLPPATAMTLYRAAQEGLTNVQKHAQAQQSTVVLDFVTDHIKLTVENNGLAHDVPGNAGFGLAGLRERAEQLGGSLAAGPLPQDGFRLAMTVPYASTD